MAESEGFEPSIRFPVYTLSRRAPSTARTTLQVELHDTAMKLTAMLNGSNTARTSISKNIGICQGYN